jgi:hypothetical protein
MSCPTAAGLVGDTIVVVSEPQVILNTKPVLASADAPAAPTMSVAIAAANAAATDRLSAFNDGENGLRRLSESLIVTPLDDWSLRP